METLAKSDIFFIVTTISVVILTILAVIAFSYFIKILRRVERLTEAVHEGSERILDSLETWRDRLKFKNLFSSLLGIFTNRRYKHRYYGE
ncbi:hypothetical protein KW783_00325 [Candidatus Parcubacteria bacterium]|nr:hypothetical protein [Candidatus Parcubacteria bacterium]